jgi:hypothetical protein
VKREPNLDVNTELVHGLEEVAGVLDCLMMLPGWLPPKWFDINLVNVKSLDSIHP